MSVKSSWNHYNPVRIVTGPVECLGAHLSARHALVVTTSGMVRRGVVARVCQALGPATIQVWDEIKPNPDLADLDQAAARFRGTGIDLVVGLGGGSAIDAAKALAFVLGGKADLTLDRVLRQGLQPSEGQSLTMAAIPTTAGTGSEVTPFATVWDHALRRKYSLNGDFVYPTLALLDASLTLSLDPDDTLFPALDAVSHALESLWNRHRTPLSQTYALQSLALSVCALPEVLSDPTDILARRRLQEAAMLAGLAISQTKTAIAHAMSYPLTLKFSMPHGLACSFSLPGLIECYRAKSLDPIEARIISDVANLLARIHLPDIAAKFITQAEGLAEVEHMFTSERADNCSFDVDRSLVERLIEQSLPR